MGADYKAIAVIGIEINEEQIPSTQFKRKTFKHSYPEAMKFSPETGEALWKEGPKFTFDPDQESEDTELIELPNIELFYGTDRSPTILGYGTDDTYSNGGNEYDFKEMPDVTAIKDSLKKALEPYELWEESKFGLYSILYCSY